VAVVVLGGVLRHEEMSLLGPIAEQVLAEFHVDIAFSGAFGIDAEAGMSGANVTEAGTDRRMLQAATRLAVLVDASKFGRRGPVRLARAEQIDYLITDRAAPADALELLRTKGVEVVTWWGGSFAPARLPESSDLLARVARAHASVGGRRQQTWAAPYGSDLRLMTNLAGMPTVHYGPGDAALAHGPDESVPVPEVLTCARPLAVLILDMCSVG
jgi:hypothetical protein